MVPFAACSGGGGSSDDEHLPTGVTGSALAQSLYVSGSEPATGRVDIKTFAIYPSSTGMQEPNPLTTLQGTNTLRFRPSAVAIGADDSIYVGGDGSDVLVLPAGSNANSLPARVLTGNAGDVYGLAVDAGNNVYVAAGEIVVGDSQSAPPHVAVFPASANGNVATTRVLGTSVPQTFGSVSGLAFDSAGETYLAEAGAPVLVFAPGASGNRQPKRTNDLAQAEAVTIH